jgi:polar amino acid transport system substrate-binding protein
VIARARLGLGLLIVVGACGACGEPPSSSALTRIQQRAQLRWGADIQGGEPYVFEDPDRLGQFIGFEAEIATALARELGVRPLLIQNDWSTLVPSLERGTFDVVINGLEVTEARAQRIAFSRPYYVFDEQLVARAGDDRIQDLRSVRGLRVGTLTNSLAWDLLEAAGALRVPYEGVEEPFADLVHGRTDAVLIDDIVVARYGNKPGLRITGEVGEGSYAIGVRKQDAVLVRALKSCNAGTSRAGRVRERRPRPWPFSSLASCRPGDRAGVFRATSYCCSRRVRG